MSIPRAAIDKWFPEGREARWFDQAAPTLNKDELIAFIGCLHGEIATLDAQLKLSKRRGTRTKGG